MGVGPDYLDRAKALISAGADALFIDAATGPVSYTHLDVYKRQALSFPLSDHIVILLHNTISSRSCKNH